MDAKLDDYYIEPGNLVYSKQVLMPHALGSASDEPIVCLVNPTDKYRTFKKDQILANAH